MKISGIPIIYIVIAVGVLGIVTYSYVSYNKPAFIADDTLKCQRQYDFSQVQFTAEAKQDWDKCYMPQPLYERNADGQVACLDYPEESCMWCALTIAIKYNNSDYCQIMKPCVVQENWQNNTDFYLGYCINRSNGRAFNPTYAIRSYAYVDHNIIHDRVRQIYPDILNITSDFQRLIYVG